LKGLEVLRAALENDDPRLIQGATCDPPPLPVTANYPVESAELFAYIGWQSEDLETVYEVDEYMSRCCFEVDQLLGKLAGCSPFLDWYDETPRAQMIAELLPEISAEIERRAEEPPPVRKLPKRKK